MNFHIPLGSGLFQTNGAQLLIAGPCVIESEVHCLGMAEKIARILEPYRDDFVWVFKSSFDKANRTSARARRGPGVEGGLKILQKIKEQLGVPVLTDIHEPGHAAIAAEVVDVLQIPAFLCRQTDLLLAAAATGKVVNIKKGQFLAPHDVRNPIEKVRTAGNEKVMITERGVCFGYNNLVVDFAGFPTMRSYGAPLIFDATHSVQLPGGLGNATGGRREMAPKLALAAQAVGVDGFFMEVHDDPDNAWSDGPNQLTPELFATLLPRLVAVRKAVS